MFDKLDDILIRLEEILNELNEPTVANDTARFQKLMKEQSDLQPIADAYREYKNCKQTVEDVYKRQPQQPAGGQQRAEEPAPAPTPENPVYARSYKSESGKEEWYEKERKKNYDSYKFTSPIPPENNKKEKPGKSQGGIGKKLGTAAALSLIHI